MKCYNKEYLGHIYIRPLPTSKSNIEYVAVLSMLPVCLNYSVANQPNILEYAEMESKSESDGYVGKT